MQGIPINIAHMPFPKQIADTAIATGQAFETKENVLQHMFAKIFDNHPQKISAADLAVQQLTYAQAHCTKYGYWFESTNKRFLPASPLKLHSKKSILQKIELNPIKGLSLNECVKEYNRAYLDLHDLLSTGEIVERNGYVWKTPPSNGPTNST